MSNLEQLQQELQNELITSNQLLHAISVELNQIKQLTNPGGEFEANINQNASLIAKLAKMENINIENLPPITRNEMHQNNHNNDTLSREQHDTHNSSNMDDSQ